MKIEQVVVVEKRCLISLIRKPASGTLLVNSTPFNSFHQGVFKQTYEDVIPIAAPSRSAVIAVNTDSKYNTWNDVVEDIKRNKIRLLVGGGSVRKSGPYNTFVTIGASEAFPAFNTFPMMAEGKL